MIHRPRYSLRLQILRIFCLVHARLACAVFQCSLQGAAVHFAVTLFLRLCNMAHAGVQVQTLTQTQVQVLPKATKQELLYGAIYRRDAEAVRVLVKLGADPWCKDPLGLRELPIYMCTKERCAEGRAGDLTFHEDLLAAMGFKPCRCEGCVECEKGRCSDGACLRAMITVSCLIPARQPCVVPLGLDQEAEARFPDYGWRSEDDSDDDEDIEQESEDE